MNDRVDVFLAQNERNEILNCNIALTKKKSRFFQSIRTVNQISSKRDITRKSGALPLPSFADVRTKSKVDRVSANVTYLDKTVIRILFQRFLVVQRRAIVKFVQIENVILGVLRDEFAHAVRGAVLGDGTSVKDE